jgi:hypothetical protein
MSETPYVPGGVIPSSVSPEARRLMGVIPSEPIVLDSIAEPSRTWRIVRMALGVLGVIALIEAIIVMTMLFALAGTVASRIGGIDPTPAATGCPFDDPADCGG